MLKKNIDVTFSSGLLFESGAEGAGGGGAGAEPLDAGGGASDFGGGGAAAGADFSAAAGAGAAGASVFASGAGGGAAAGASFLASGGGGAAFLSSFFPASNFEASAAVGKSALIVALLKGTRFFFSFKNQLFSPPTYYTHIKDQSDTKMKITTRKYNFSIIRF